MMIYHIRKVCLKPWQATIAHSAEHAAQFQQRDAGGNTQKNTIGHDSSASYCKKSTFRIHAFFCPEGCSCNTYRCPNKQSSRASLRPGIRLSNCLIPKP